MVSYHFVQSVLSEKSGTASFEDGEQNVATGFATMGDALVLVRCLRLPRRSRIG